MRWDLAKVVLLVECTGLDVFKLPILKGQVGWILLALAEPGRAFMSTFTGTETKAALDNFINFVERESTLQETTGVAEGGFYISQVVLSMKLAAVPGIVAVLGPDGCAEFSEKQPP